MFTHDADDGEDQRDTDGENENLHPLAKLESFATSQNPFNRQMASRLVLDTLREVSDSQQDVAQVLYILHTLADDSESMVRCELIEHVPRIAALCHDEKDKLLYIARDYLLPMVVNFLMDADSQVRKTNHAALLMLIDYQWIPLSTIEEQVCPVVIDLTELDNMKMTEFRSGAVSLMIRMAPLIGKEATQRLFMNKFIRLCSDPVCYMREVCAKNFGDVAAVIGVESTEQNLLSTFIELCQDASWTVRKACAEVFLSVSCCCSLQTRKSILSPAFAKLLVDDASVVRASAFQDLGLFISTFADPSLLNLSYNQQGELVLVNSKGSEFSLRSPQRQCFYSLNNIRDGISDDMSDMSCLISNKPSDSCYEPDEDNTTTSLVDNNNSDELEEFNSFQYWKSPLPELDISKELLEETKEIKTLDEELITLSEKLEKCSPTTSDEAVTPDSGWNSANTTPPLSQTSLNKQAISGKPNISELEILYADFFKEEEQAISEFVISQAIVPQKLLNYFVSMTDPLHAETFDQEIPQYCAYSLPGVALTLGKTNWFFIKDAYKKLSQDVQWRVRYTVAASLHEIAAIIGELNASKDLVPIFEGFIKDLDEVRIGSLQHMSKFFKLLPHTDRDAFLPRLKDFFNTDNKRNWRFREELAEQLNECLALFSPLNCMRHVAALAARLLCDKVAAVRAKAITLMAFLIRRVEVEESFLNLLINKLNEEFATSRSWVCRQVFALLCSRVAETRVWVDDHVLPLLIPHLLKLASDPVPNVRLSVARCLASDILSACLDMNENLRESCEEVLSQLRSDRDSDVKFFAMQGISSDPL